MNSENLENFDETDLVPVGYWEKISKYLLNLKKLKEPKDDFDIDFLNS